MRDFLSHRCVFVQVPKTAGVAVAESLFGNRGAGHRTYQELRDVFERAYRVRDFDLFFTFAFVRNPWDRLHSAYQFLMAGGMLPEDEEFARQTLHCFDDFNEFVKGWVTPAHVASWLHFRTQSEFLVDVHGDVGVSFVGRYERIGEDYEHVRRTLGFGAPLCVRNATRGRTSYRDAYNAESRQIVAEVYEEDIRRFGYEF